MNSVRRCTKRHATVLAILEKVRLHYEQSLKDYDECLEQRFLEGAGEWRHPKPGRLKFSEEEIKIIMDAESDWDTKNMNKKLASMLEGRSTSQVSQDT
jgi:hypothetical protein